MPNPNHLWYLEVIMPDGTSNTRVFDSRTRMKSWARDSGLVPRLVENAPKEKRHTYTCVSPILFDVWSD